MVLPFSDGRRSEQYRMECRPILLRALAYIALCADLYWLER